MHQFILASNSPRRKELLESLGYKFIIQVTDVDEESVKADDIQKLAEKIAIFKNDESRRLFNQLKDIIITADTVVALSGQSLGKPKNINEAYKFLKRLSGNIHQVISGVCISSESKSISFTEVTEVKFRPIFDDEIDYYIQNYTPLDKAGAYGIQEWLGMTHISEIKGSYYNVVGLPLHLIYEKLKSEFGVSPLPR